MTVDPRTDGEINPGASLRRQKRPGAALGHLHTHPQAGLQAPHTRFENKGPHDGTKLRRFTPHREIDPATRRRGPWFPDAAGLERQSAALASPRGPSFAGYRDLQVGLRLAVWERVAHRPEKTGRHLEA